MPSAILCTQDNFSLVLSFEPFAVEALSGPNPYCLIPLLVRTHKVFQSKLLECDFTVCGKISFVHLLVRFPHRISMFEVFQFLLTWKMYTAASLMTGNMMTCCMLSLNYLKDKAMAVKSEISVKSSIIDEGFYLNSHWMIFLIVQSMWLYFKCKVVKIWQELF